MYPIDSLTLPPDATLREAMRLIDATRVQIALVVDGEQKLLGVCTDGDIRRALLNHENFDLPVRTAMNPQPAVASVHEHRSAVLSRMRRLGLLQIPVLDDSGRVHGLTLLADPRKDDVASTPVVLMAGGLGLRLRPLTEECPKPLLPLGGRPILERIIERFAEQGFRNFYISINYLGHMIEKHFGDGEHFNVNISYLREDAALGTAGSLALMPKDFDSAFIVMNADLITDLNFKHLLEAHYGANATATMCVREHRTVVPFGVVEFNGLNYAKTVEKPALVHHVNAGIYCFSRNVLDSLKEAERLDMPDLFTNLTRQSSPCSVYVTADLWTDIGTIEEYERAKQLFHE